MTIAIFGGAFDPPHLGHLKIIKSLLEQDIADEVWLVPTGVHDFDKQMVLSEHRLQMLELLLGNLETSLKNSVKINKFELNSTEVNQTYDTLQELAAQNPEEKLSWIMGADNLAKFHLWDNYQQILSNYLVYIYPRPGYQMQPLYTGMIPMTGVEQTSISSTEIREYISSGDKTKLQLPLSIFEYIKKHQLYF